MFSLIPQIFLVECWNYALVVFSRTGYDCILFFPIIFLNFILLVELPLQEEMFSQILQFLKYSIILLYSLGKEFLCSHPPKVFPNLYFFPSWRVVTRFCICTLDFEFLLLVLGFELSKPLSFPFCLGVLDCTNHLVFKFPWLHHPIVDYGNQDSKQHLITLQLNAFV